MTEHDAALWIAFVTRRSVDDVLALEMDRATISTLGHWLASNPQLELLDPPTHIYDKPITFRCACGQEVHTTYRTRKPKYCSSACRQRAYRRRKAQAFEGLPTRPAALARKNGNGRGFMIVRELREVGI